MSKSANKRFIISHLNPKSPIAEAYRTLRTNIQFSSVDDKLQVIMVTSAGPGEGKSTTVSNLAATYAQSYQKVLVIEADLRKPTVHHTFNQTNREGITNVLTNQAVAQDVIRVTEIPNLHVITSGPIPPNPSEILGSKRMAAFLDEMKQIYDIIILDTPPILVITDAQVVATLCDGVILVVESGKVKKDVVLRAKVSLQNVQARIIGVVINSVNVKNGDYSYYYYYGHKEE